MNMAELLKYDLLNQSYTISIVHNIIKRTKTRIKILYFFAAHTYKICRSNILSEHLMVRDVEKKSLVLVLCLQTLEG